MKINRLILIVLIFLVPSFADAHDIVLPHELAAQAFIFKSDQDGLWEKTLIVQFPQRKRVLSTNDGAVDAWRSQIMPLTRTLESRRRDHEIDQRRRRKDLYEQDSGEDGPTARLKK